MHASLSLSVIPGHIDRHCGWPTRSSQMSALWVTHTCEWREGAYKGFLLSHTSWVHLDAGSREQQPGSEMARKHEEESRAPWWSAVSLLLYSVCYVAPLWPLPPSSNPQPVSSCARFLFFQEPQPGPGSPYWLPQYLISFQDRLPSRISIVISFLSAFITCALPW